MSSQSECDNAHLQVSTALSEVCASPVSTTLPTWWRIPTVIAQENCQPTEFVSDSLH